MLIDKKLIIQNAKYIVPLIIALFLIISTQLNFNKRRIKNRGVLNTLKKISENRVIKKLQYPPNSKEYRNIELRLKKAGFKNMTVGTYQMVKYTLPLIMYVFIVSIRYTNIYVSITNIDKLKKIAELTGDISATQIDSDLMLLPLFGYSLVFYFLPELLLKVITGLRNTRGNKEIMMLHTYAVMMLKSKRSVKQILISLMNRAKIYKPEFEIAVNSYSKNPHGVIQELSEQVGHPQFEKVCIGLQQALNDDPDLSIEYLKNSRNLGKNLNKLNRKKKTRKKSIIGLMLLVIPMLGLAIVGGYPWLVFSLRQLDCVPI